MIPEILKTEIEKKTSDDFAFYEGDFLYIKIDDLKEILERYFKEEPNY